MDASPAGPRSTVQARDRSGAPDADARRAPRNRRPLTALITGFGPFPGAPFNPTEGLVRSLVRRRRPTFAGMQLAGHIFRTSYAAVDAELRKLIDEHRPDVLLMFGLASRTRHLRIEVQAKSRQSVLFSDVDGGLQTVRERHSAPLRGRAPFARLVAAARAGRIPVGLSHDAGRYLCNYVYRQALSLPHEQAPRVTVFIHVPQVRRAPVPRSRIKRRGTTAADLLRGAEAILLVLTTAARAR